MHSAAGQDRIFMEYQRMAGTKKPSKGGTTKK
jgi:hypothetical protein